MKRNQFALAAALSLVLLSTSTVVSAAETAPRYVDTVAQGIDLQVLATSGDVINGYQIAGIPDGTGVMSSGKNLTLLMNHEISFGDVSKTLVRAGGSALGSTVSKFTLNTSSKSITNAQEFLTSALFYDYSAKTWGSTASAPAGATASDSYGTPQHTSFLNRFCSSSLSPAGRFFYKKGKKSYGIKNAVYLTGEEGGDESRGFAISPTGQLVQIPGFGLAAWETFNNIKTGTRTTAVFGNEDGSATDSQLWLYQGTKQSSGTWFNKAGLTNGKTYVMSIAGFAKESDVRKNIGKNNPAAVTFQSVDADQNGVALNKAAALAGTSMARIEDGAFDPKNPAVYYFVTTESNKDSKATTLDPTFPLVTKRDGGALWKLVLNNVKNPAAGGQITMLLDGSEAPFMNKPDNIEVDGYGNILIQEDPGNSPQLTRMFAYRISDGKLVTLNQFNAAMFSADKKDPSFITEDEETSGVLNVTKYFRRSATDKNFYYIFVAQIHATGAALLKARPDIKSTEAQAALSKAIEGGQIYLMTISNWSTIYGQ